jgi:hypothetical protein
MITRNFRCPVCKAIYATRLAAIACLHKHPPIKHEKIPFVSIGKWECPVCAAENPEYQCLSTGRYWSKQEAIRCRDSKHPITSNQFINELDRVLKARTHADFSRNTAFIFDFNQFIQHHDLFMSQAINGEAVYRDILVEKGVLKYSTIMYSKGGHCDRTESYPHAVANNKKRVFESKLPDFETIGQPMVDGVIGCCQQLLTDEWHSRNIHKIRNDVHDHKIGFVARERLVSLPDKAVMFYHHKDIVIDAYIEADTDFWVVAYVDADGYAVAFDRLINNQDYHENRLIHVEPNPNLVDFFREMFFGENTAEEKAKEMKVANNF